LSDRHGRNSDQVHPDQITAILSFTPDHTVLKGADRDPPRPVPKSFGWYVTSMQQGGGTVDGVLSLLLKRPGLLYGKLQSLYEADPDVRVEFHVSVVPPAEKISLYFRPETINGLSKFGGSLDLEFFDA